MEDKIKYLIGKQTRATSVQHHKQMTYSEPLAFHLLLQFPEVEYRMESEN